MVTATKVKLAVKESLLGSEDPSKLSAQTRAAFLSHARKDGETGELYMGEEEFIDAIAPKKEDYVSSILLPSSRRNSLLVCFVAAVWTITVFANYVYSNWIVC